MTFCSEIDELLNAKSDGAVRCKGFQRKLSNVRKVCIFAKRFIQHGYLRVNWIDYTSV